MPVHPEGGKDRQQQNLIKAFLKPGPVNLNSFKQAYLALKQHTLKEGISWTKIFDFLILAVYLHRKSVESSYLITHNPVLKGGIPIKKQSNLKTGYPLSPKSIVSYVRYFAVERYACSRTAGHS